VNRSKSYVYGKGNLSFQGPQPAHQDQSVIDARAISMTFWELV
jgi:hypothetical protein